MLKNIKTYNKNVYYNYINLIELHPIPAFERYILEISDYSFQQMADAIQKDLYESK